MPDIQWIRTISGVPSVANFGGTFGLGSPLIIDSATNTPYYLKAGVVTAFKDNDTGNVVGPASSTDNALARYDGTTGKLLQTSLFLVNDAGIPALTSLVSLASAIGPTIADYFTSTLSLDANSTYEIECRVYFLKTTAGTVVFTWQFSSAPFMVSSFYRGTPATGFTTTTITGAPVHGEAHRQGNTTVAHAATASLTTAVYHVYIFTVTVTTNAATTIQLRATESAGTITPQAGSFMRATKII